MEVEIKTWLYDIIQSIDEIDSYFTGEPRIFEEYLADKKTQRAIERNLEIIGEAVNRVLKTNKDLKIESAKQIIGTRNRIIHGYDTITQELIWSIVINHLPKLRGEVNKLLNG